MSGNDGGDGFDWEEREQAKHKQIGELRAKGYRPNDIQHILNSQDRAIADHIKTGKPLKPLLESIARNPAATSVEPDKETVRQIEEARAAQLRTEQRRNVPLVPTRPEPTVQPQRQNDSAIAQEAKRQEANKQEYALPRGLSRPPYEVLRDQGKAQPTDKAEQVKKLAEEARRKIELHRAMKQGKGRGL